MLKQSSEPNDDAAKAYSRKRLQKISNPEKVDNMHTKRRSTLRETSKPTLLGPRPMDSTKRVTSDSNHPQYKQSSIASTSSFEHLYQNAINSNSTPTRIPNTSSEFLPSISFDDLHTSITGKDADLTSRFPALSSSSSFNYLLSDHIHQSPSQDSRLTRRQGSQNSLQSPPSMPPPPLSTNISTNSTSRRQSTMPSTSASRQSRKSVGPTFSAHRSRSASREPGTGKSLLRSGSVNTRPNRATVMIPNEARFAKTKSLLPSSTGQTQFTNFSNSISSLTSERNSPHPRGSQTPSSGNANRRMSTVHVGGLGARTISPTDARRMKRLSSVPKMPPPPSIPSPMPVISQPDLLGGAIRQNSQSPAAFARKTSTPSSARNTPDSNRKSISSNQTISSTPSFISNIRQPNPAGPRTSQILQTSKLPTLKPRVQSSIGFAQEEVPPVPAIPKAFESPKDQPPDAYFPPSRKSISNESDNSASGSSLPNSRPNTVKPVLPPNTRHRRGMTVGAGSDSDRSNSQSNLNKKNLQPLRLPPLNLLPLNTPTSSRIASLPASSLEGGDSRISTPPPKRNVTKTPSTPMTASKATFYSSYSSIDDPVVPPFNNFRSSSSHHPLRPNDLESKNHASVPMAGPRNNHNASPFASNSLPKTVDVTTYPSTPDGHVINRQLLHGPNYPPPSPPGGISSPDITQSNQQTSDVVSSKTSHQPSPLITAQNVQSNTFSSGSDEPSTPGTGNSLRRKLSLNWKRSSSKASQRVQEENKNSNNHKTEMGPPKIPAHNNWTSRTSSDGGSVQPVEIKNYRKPSSSSFQQTKVDGGSMSDSSKGETNQIPQYTRSSSTSLLTPVQRMLGSKSSISTLKNRNLDTNLDKDDLAADKIMEKLASKRKDFETAAKDVDELRKRANAKDRMSPAQAIQHVSLNIFERGEIVDFKDVFFCGTKHAKKIIGDPAKSATNFGYDDDRGDYNIILGDHLAYRYEVVDVLGKGSFGQVVRCIDHKTGGLMAIKIIRNKKRFHQQALVEVNILQKLREWDPENKHSMISFTQSFYFRGHLCISTELLGINLYEFIKAYEFKGFPLILIKRFTKQILSSLMLLKTKRVIHCDLKPENILLAHPMHSEIKVIDFGSSCFENEKVYTYIQSRFYRSPEVILGMSYGLPIDMWSLGCILAELLTGYPIFPGENEQEQLACIMEIFGPPEKHLIEKSSRKKLFFDSLGKPRVTVSSKGRRRRPSSRTLQSAIKCDDEAFLEFLTLCLRWDPDKRLKPEQALCHEFITGLKPSRQPSYVRNTSTRAPSTSHISTSPTKRSHQIPVSLQSGTPQQSRIRPLPEPPGNPPPAFRPPGSTTASPSKTNGPRRHSTVHATPSSLVPGPPGKRVHTITGGIKVPSGQSGQPGQNQRALSGRPGNESSNNNNSSSNNGPAAAAAAAALVGGR